MADLFVDTGAFYAAADRSDAHHLEAAETFGARGASGDLVTTDHVVIETWLLVRARLGREAAMQFWDAMETGVVRVFGVTAADFSGLARAVADPMAAKARVRARVKRNNFFLVSLFSPLFTC